MNRQVLITVVLWSVTCLILWFVLFGVAWAGPRWVDPCLVNPERCSRGYRALTPGQRFEAQGLPAPESRDRLYRWDDEDVGDADLEATDDAADEGDR